MNDNYLWDRTGEPDPEIQRLEELLGTLRYEPRPLAIPTALPVAPRRSFAPTLAIAATIALMILAAGVWFAVHRKAALEPTEAVQRPVQQKVNDKPAVAGSLNRKESASPVRHDVLTPAPQPRHVITVAHSPRRQTKPTPSDMSASEMAVAKDQLLLALRVASSKLNLAQRRTQTTTPPPPQIRNQHRIG